MSTTREFLVGLVFFGLLLLLGVFTIVLTDVRIGPEPPSLVIYFNDVEGLEEGDDVWINGYRSGKVADVHPDHERNEMKVTVYFDFEPVLYGDATFCVKPASPLGGRILAITRGSLPADRRTEEQKRLPEFLVFDAEHEGTATADVLTEAAQLIDENRESLHEAIQGIGTFAHHLSVNGPATLRRLDSAIERIDIFVKGIDEGPVGVLLRDQEVASDFKAVIDNLAGATAGFEDLISDGALREDIKKGASAIRGFAERVQAGKGTLARLIDDAALHDSAVRILENVEKMTRRFDGDGGIAATFMGPKSWGHLESSLASIDALLADVNTAKDNRDTPLGAILRDDEIVPGIRTSISTISSLLEDTRENAPIATFAGFLFSAF
jgi:MlaD protein